MTKAEMKRAAFALVEFEQKYESYDTVARKYCINREEIDGWNPRFMWCLDAIKEKHPGFMELDDLSGGQLEASILLSEACA
jgi:hypothetical protein